MRVNLKQEASVNLSGRLLLKPGINDVDERLFAELMATSQANRWYVDSGRIEPVHAETMAPAPSAPVLTPEKAYTQPDPATDVAHQEAVAAAAQEIAAMNAKQATEAIGKVDRLEVLVALAELESRKTVIHAIESRADEIKVASLPPADPEELTGKRDTLPPHGAYKSPAEAMGVGKRRPPAPEPEE